VTNCPNGPHEVTVTVPLYTTVCPVTETETTPPATSGPSGPETIRYTTSTVVTTSVYTVTSCAPTVTNCPVGQVTTDIITLYTTVCPVSEETGTPVSVPLPPFTGVPTSIPGGNAYSVAPTPGTESAVPYPTYVASSSGELTTTSTSTTRYTSYVTVQVVQSTATVIPVPKYPTPVKEVSSAFGTGTGVPSGFTYSPVSTPTTAAGGEVTYPASSTSTPFAGAGVRVSGSMSLVAAIFVGAIAMVL